MTEHVLKMEDMIAMMDAKGTVTRRIQDLVEENDKVCYLNSDGTGRGRTKQLMDQYPDRILDVGIAEMNLVSVAAGLALRGYMPFAQTFGPFLCVRALDQIHTDIAYNNLPVRLIGTHGGTSSGYGPTHNTIVDFAVMNALPNMTMVAPADAKQCIKLIEASVDYDGPIYIRIPRGEEPVVYQDDFEYEIGKSIEVKAGHDATIIATGSSVYNSLQAASLLEEQGLSVRVIDMHTIKPIDQEAIVKAAKETKAIITVEDHNIEGGLGSIVADVLMQAGRPTKFKKIGIPDVFVPFGYPEEIHPHYGLDGQGIAKTIQTFLNI